jgi:hypothetical protein
VVTLLFKALTGEAPGDSVSHRNPALRSTKHNESADEPRGKWRREGGEARNLRVGDELGLGVGILGLHNLDDALEGHPLVGNAADDDGFLGRVGVEPEGPSPAAAGVYAARRVVTGAGELEAATLEAGGASEERAGVGLDAVGSSGLEGSRRAEREPFAAWLMSSIVTSCSGLARSRRWWRVGTEEGRRCDTTFWVWVV